MLRPHTDAFLHCTISEDTYTALVSDWLSSRENKDEPLNSLGLGRLVTYPWLSSALAEAATVHPAWDAKRGRARNGDANALVASMLSSDVLLAGIARPFAGSGYRVTGVSVEKVLVAPAGQVLPGYGDAGALLPYDAQTWLVLTRER